MRQITISPVRATSLALYVSPINALELVNTEDTDVHCSNNFY